MSCPFCEIKTAIVRESPLGIVFLDRYPVTKGHSLIIPKSHKVDWFALSKEEQSELMELVDWQRQNLLESDEKISGFNIGMNCGASAGQSVFHCHIHLIPRRGGDSKSPRGGVRGVIPEKQDY